MAQLKIPRCEENYGPYQYFTDAQRNIEMLS